MIDFELFDEGNPIGPFIERLFSSQKKKSASEEVIASLERLTCQS